MRLTSFENAGLTFDVTDQGPLDGPAVVLLHGFPADRHCWDEIGEHLTRAGLRVLAPDQRGYSPRARPQGRAAYAMAELVGDVLALLDAAGLDRAHLVGHDWGGAVAWAAAGTHPDRFATLTVLSTPHPAAFARALRHPAQAWHSLYMLWFQLPWLPERTFSRILPRALRRSGLPPDVTQRYLAAMAQPGALTAALGWYRASRLSHGLVHRIRIPTSYVWGRGDRFFSRRGAEATGPLVTADYRFVELAEGHWLPEVAAAVCAREIEHRASTGATGDPV